MYNFERLAADSKVGSFLFPFIHLRHGLRSVLYAADWK